MSRHAGIALVARITQPQYDSYEQEKLEALFEEKFGEYDGVTINEVEYSAAYADEYLEYPGICTLGILPEIIIYDLYGGHTSLDLLNKGFKHLEIWCKQFCAENDCTYIIDVVATYG